MTQRIRLLFLVILGAPLFLSLAFLGLWAYGIIGYAPSLYQEFHQEFPYNKVTGMEVAPLYLQPELLKEGTTEFDRFKVLPKFHDYRVDGPWRTIGPQHVDEATDLIFTPDVLYSDKVTDCFDPEFALKIQTDIGPIDMLVCLECERALLVKPDGSVDWMVSFSPSGLRSAKAFYVDCFVMKNLGLTPSAQVTNPKLSSDY